MKQVTGTCSICGGTVSVESPWWGIMRPPETCESCGAVRANSGPVIPMTPNPKLWDIKAVSSTGSAAWMGFMPETLAKQAGEGKP